VRIDDRVNEKKHHLVCLRGLVKCSSPRKRTPDEEAPSSTLYLLRSGRGVKSCTHSVVVLGFFFSLERKSLVITIGTNIVKGLVFLDSRDWRGGGSLEPPDLRKEGVEEARVGGKRTQKLYAFPRLKPGTDRAEIKTEEKKDF